MAPILSNVKNQIGDKASIIKVDVDKNPAAAQAYQVRGVPTLILFKKGQILWKESGVISEQQLAKVIQQHI
jgi:thioredoxin 1